MSEDAKLFTDGQAYERLMGRWSRIAGQSFLDWLDAPKNLKWLDVGCGNGAFTEELIARSAPAAVSAIDPSDEQLAYAQTRPGVKMTEFRVGDAENLPFGDDTFDVAVMALVISFLRDSNKAAAEMARVVRPGGWVAAYMWDLPAGGAPTYPIYLALESMGEAAVRPPNYALSERDAMRGLWEKIGLESVDTQVIFETAYSDLNDFCASNLVPIGPQGKVISRMSASAREELRARLREYLPVSSDGRIVYESFANAVRGRVPA